MPPDASQAAASATAHHHQNKPQNHANASKAAACATVNHHQNTPQNQTKTQRHTTHENCLTSLSEALKEEVIYYYTAKATTRLHLEKMGPDASASNVAASATANHPRNKLQHHANASKAAACATVNHHQNTPQNQTKTQRHTTHENCLTSLSEALKEEVIYYYTAKATTRLHLEKMGPDASASNVAASATANHPRNKPQHHANASKAAACATVNHHQNTPQNQTKTQRHTTHENCLTSLSEALKEEVITPPRQRPDCIWRRWVQMHLHPM